VTYFVIGDEDTVLGFSMVGVEGRVVNTIPEAESAFDSVLADKAVGIIIITELAADLVRLKVNKLLFSTAFPLIVEIPDRCGSLPGRPGIQQMVNNAIGINLG
jgi:V/A-type H+-transporting ATPase subunit F